MSADTATTKKELIVTSCGCGDDGKRIFKGSVEICDGTTTTMADIRSLIVDEFDQDMLPKESDWVFFVDGVRLSLKQEKRRFACNYLYKEIRIESKSAIPTIAKQQTQQEQVDNNISKKPPIVSTTTSTAATNAATMEQTGETSCSSPSSSHCDKKRPKAHHHNNYHPIQNVVSPSPNTNKKRKSASTSTSRKDYNKEQQQRRTEGKEEVAAVKMSICLDVDETEQESEIQRTTKRNPRYQNEKVAPVAPAAAAASSREQPEMIELSSDSETEDSSIKLNCNVSLIRHRRNNQQATEKAKQNEQSSDDDKEMDVTSRKVAPRKSIARYYRSYSEEPRSEMQSGRHAEDAIECYSSDDEKTKEGGVRDNDGVGDGSWTQKDMDGSEGSKNQSMNPPTNDDLISDSEMNNPTGARKRKEEDAKCEAPTKIATPKKQRQRKKRKEENGLNRKISDSEMDSPMNDDKEVRMEEEGEREEEDALSPGKLYELSRIAIGSRVETERCRAVFNNKDQILTLAFQHSGISQLIPIPLTDSNFVCAKCFSRRTTTKIKTKILEEAEGWVAFSIKKDDSCGQLGRAFRMYNPKANDNKKKYIVLEFPNYADMESIQVDLGITFNDKIEIISLINRIEECSASLIDHRLQQKAKKAVQSLDKELKLEAKRKVGAKLIADEGMSDNSSSSDEDDEADGNDDEENFSATRTKKATEHSFLSESSPCSCFAAAAQQQPTLRAEPQEINPKPSGPRHIGPGQAASDAKESQVDSHEAIIRPNNIANGHYGDDAMPSGLKEGSSIDTATTTALNQKDDSSKIRIVVLGGRYDRHLGDFYHYVERDDEVYCEVGLEINGYLTVHIIKEDYIFPRQDVQLTTNDNLVAGHRCWGAKDDNTPDKNRTGVIREIGNQLMSRVVWDGGAVESHAIPWGTMFPYVVHAMVDEVPKPVLF